MILGKHPAVPDSLAYYVQGRTVSYPMGQEWGTLTFPTPEEAEAWTKERESLERTAPRQKGPLSREKQMERYL